MMRKRNSKFIFIAGPCVIEDKKTVLNTASYLKEISLQYPVDFIFKASFYKANRTSIKSFRGPGLTKGLRILEEVKRKFGIRVLSDVHCRSDIREAKDVLDVIQIPAFLSRQTDLIIKAAQTNKIINIKKAQFMSPYDIKYVIEKITSVGNKKIFITERGTCFGYNNLVVDFRSFLIMRKFDYPVIFDVTHSLQRPSLLKGVSGGDRAFVEPMALAGVACGVDGLFLEVHPWPRQARSDKATVFPLKKIRKLLDNTFKIRKALDED